MALNHLPRGIEPTASAIELQVAERPDSDAVVWRQLPRAELPVSAALPHECVNVFGPADCGDQRLYVGYDFAGRLRYIVYEVQGVYDCQAMAEEQIGVTPLQPSLRLRFDAEFARDACCTALYRLREDGYIDFPGDILLMDVAVPNARTELPDP